jgi:hypothetical protein
MSSRNGPGAGNGCRVGRVRLKSGGELRVFDGSSGGNPEIVDKLLELLTRARKGEVVAIAMVVVSPNGTVSTGWEIANGPYYHHLSSGALTLAGRMGAAK